MFDTQATVTCVGSWDTLAKRVAWIKANRDLSLRAWAREAEIGESTVAQTLHREKTEGKATFSGANVARLAKAANVDPHWLNTGEGEPEPGARPALQPAMVSVAVDTQQIANEAARMLVELDGLALPDALVAVHDVRLPTPTVDGYYRAARRALAARATDDPKVIGERGVITREIEEAAEHEVRASIPSRRAHK